VSGVGVVVSGLVKNGALAMNQRMLLGPCPDGSFRAVLLKSLHLKRLPVDAARMGDSVSISVRVCVCVRLRAEARDNSAYINAWQILICEL
jgi:GTPase